jgi:uncharacterized delta-60 repeat protein
MKILARPLFVSTAQSRYLLSTFITAFLLLMFCGLNAQATPGDLDTTFGTGGKVITHVGSNFDVAKGVVIQPDGKIVVVGLGNGFTLARYNTDGRLDTSFNGTGKVTTLFNGGAAANAYAVALQADGKIIVAGSSLNDFALARYNTNGTLDTSFNSTGTVTTPIGNGDDAANAVAIQPDGKIVAAGYAKFANYDFALVRYNTDGTLDPAFNGTGKVTTAFGNGDDFAKAVAIQRDDRIIVAGYAQFGNNDFALARYNADGTPDASFNTTGKVTTPIGNNDESALAVALQIDSKIVIPTTPEWRSKDCASASSI